MSTWKPWQKGALAVLVGLIVLVVVVVSLDDGEEPSPSPAEQAEQEADPMDRGTQFSGEEARVYNQARDICADAPLDELAADYNVAGTEHVREGRHSERDLEWAAQMEKAVAEDFAQRDPHLFTPAEIGCLDGMRERELAPGPAPRRP